MKFLEDFFYVVVRRKASVSHIILTEFERGAIILVGNIDAIVSGLDILHRSDKLILSVFRPFGRTLHQFVNLTLGHAKILARRKQPRLLDTRRVSFRKEAITDGETLDRLQLTTETGPIVCRRRTEVGREQILFHWLFRKPTHGTSAYLYVNGLGE